MPASEASFLTAEGCSSALSHGSCTPCLGTPTASTAGEAFCLPRLTPRLGGQSPLPHSCPCASVGLGQRPKWVAFSLGFHTRFLNLLLKEQLRPGPLMSGRLPLRTGRLSSGGAALGLCFRRLHTAAGQAVFSFENPCPGALSLSSARQPHHILQTSTKGIQVRG